MLETEFGVDLFLQGWNWKLKDTFTLGMLITSHCDTPLCTSRTDSGKWQNKSWVLVSCSYCRKAQYMSSPTDAEFNAMRALVLFTPVFCMGQENLAQTFSESVSISSLECSSLIPYVLDLSSGITVNYSHQPPVAAFPMCKDIVPAYFSFPPGSSEQWRAEQENHCLRWQPVISASCL